MNIKQCEYTRIPSAVFLAGRCQTNAIFTTDTKFRSHKVHHSSDKQVNDFKRERKK